MKRTLSLVAALVLLLVLPAEVLAVTADATPESQSHAYGVASSWTGTWTGTSPFTDKFCYGDTTCTTHTNDTLHSRPFSHTYFPCVTTTYAAYLKVTDDSEVSATDNVSATESGGPSC